MEIAAVNLQESFYRVMAKIREYGEDVEVRGLKTKEIHPCLIKIEKPYQRTLLCPKRGNNPFATLAETMWVLAGRNDMEWLEPFLPRCKDFSDDGKVWRAGYGPRLKNWPNYILTEERFSNPLGGKSEYIYKANRTINQYEFVIKQLMKDPACRQAVMTIWDPAIECTVPNLQTKDWPCTSWLHFMIRNGKLDLTVVMRSNDSVFGYSGINVYEFTVIQELISACLRIPIGNYYHLSDSMHVYEQHYKKMDELLAPGNRVDIDFNKLPWFGFFAMRSGFPIEDLKANLEMVDHLVSCIETNMSFNCIDKYLVSVWLLLSMYKQNYKKDTWPDYVNIMEFLEFTDLKVAVHYWYSKNILKRKDTGYGLIQECIEQCLKNNFSDI